MNYLTNINISNENIIFKNITNLSSKLLKVIKNYKDKITFLLVGASLVGASLLNTGNISGILHNKVDIKKVSHINSLSKDNKIEYVSDINSKNTENANYISQENHEKIKHLFGNNILKFLRNKYNISENSIVFYINKSNNYLNNTINDAWNEIVKSDDNNYKYIKSNLLKAYGSEDNVKNAIKKIILIENSGVKNTKRDIAEFLLKWGMSEDIYTFKSNEYSNKGAVGICQITKKAVNEVNNRFNFNTSFDQVSKNHKESIKYAMMLQAIHYDILRYDIDIKVSKRINNNKFSKNKKNKSQDVKFVTTDSIFYKVSRNLPQENLLRLNKYILAISYNKGGPSVKKEINKVMKEIINKKNKKNKTDKKTVEIVENSLFTALYKNLPQETKGYSEKFKNISKLLNI